MRQIDSMPFHEDVMLRHAFEDLAIPLRQPDPDEVCLEQKLMANADERARLKGMELLLLLEAARLAEYAKEHPTETVPVHAIRVGELAAVTQPCELFTQFGLDIKRRSPFPATVICGVADGYSGFCPTVAGILGGGFTGKAILSCRLSHEAGHRIVDSACRLLAEVR